MQEFLSLYSKIENPTLEMVLFTFLLAFLLSSLIAFTYDRTAPHTLRSSNFIQALILSSLVATTIMQAIGDSVATGLGMLGALAIIRFRTNLRDPRDMIFMFAALGTGIACGVYGFFIAVIGAIGFCVVAFVLRYTPYYIGNNIPWELRVRIPNDDDKLFMLDELLGQYCRYWNQTSIRKIGENEEKMIIEYEYILIMHNDNQRKAFLDTLEENGIKARRFAKQTEISPFF